MPPVACTLMRAWVVAATQAGSVRVSQPSLGVAASRVVGKRQAAIGGEQNIDVGGADGGLGGVGHVPGNLLGRAGHPGGGRVGNRHHERARPWATTTTCMES